ncbi:ketopantoate reductase family protein [Streptomyces sp. NBC_00335]|uniref:ketopantoate reductase family protein n=1 Tax=unclassified Streptomyces TaxID=2593676 RepID=UPI0022533DAC|nr:MULTISPECIES: ketopantoate reductase family protein [unclassified Streptomyces]MCX5407697.1 ketopantoate reductase family protein [Streptomyces sp. NBC_00086]
MRILTVGAGAAGGYFGARLARAGRDVTFLVRPRRAEALRARGLRVSGPGEEIALDPQLVTADALAPKYDLVLLSVKSTSLEAAVRDLAPAVGPGTVILPLLNGMAHLDRLTDRFGEAAVLGGVAKVVTTLNEHGDILRLAPPTVLLTGELDGRPSARVDAVREVLAGAGIDTPEVPDIVGAMWHKWVFITSLVAVTSLARGAVGEVNAVPGGTEFGLAVLSEAAAVSAAAGHPVPESELAFTARTLAAPGSPLTPSMYRDLVAGHPTEVEHVLGDLTARARGLAVPTPLLDLAALQLRVHQRRVAGA